MKLVITLIFSMILMPVSLFAIQQHAGEIIINKDKVSKTLQQLAREYKIPDYSIVVVTRDSVLFTLDRNPQNAGMNYLIGSCAKSFTALAVMNLSEDGMIGLDKPVKDYLPWFEMKNKLYSNLVTVRHLLNHKSGFARQDGFFDMTTNNVTFYEMRLEAFIKQKDVKSAPGTAFSYSNLNYVLLGLIVRHVTGHTYAEYLARYIIPAAGMNKTYFTGDENRTKNYIQPHQYTFCFIPVKSRDYYYSDFLVPAGHISSNAGDLAKYLRFLLNRTAMQSGDTLLSAESFDSLTGRGQTGYAMGWFRYEEDSTEIVNHAGLNENFSSSLAFFPDLGVGVAVLCNINSLEFCARAEQEIRSEIMGKSYPAPRFSFEKIMRWGVFIIPVIIVIGLIYNFFRWRKNEFQVDLVRGFLPNFRLIVAIILSLILLFGVTSTFQMHIVKSIRFQPDIGWGLVLIAILGIISSFIHYFGTVPLYSSEPI